MAAHVLVTGGAGFIGSHLTRRLLERGERVTVLDDFNDFYSPALKHSNVLPFLDRPDYQLVQGDIRKLANAQTRVIDLQGRTVIPGLIDSHMHAIRAALSFATEVNWIG